MTLPIRTITKWIGALAIAALAPLASANLVSNPGFEDASGDIFTSVIPLPSWFRDHDVVTPSIGSDFHTGNVSAVFGPDTVAGLGAHMTQSLTGLDGPAGFTIDFWMKCVSGANKCLDDALGFLFTVQLGAEELANTTDYSIVGSDNTPEFTHYSAMFGPLVGDAILSFNYFGEQEVYFLDDINLTPKGIPEPGTLLLLGAALTAGAMLRRRKQS